MKKEQESIHQEFGRFLRDEMSDLDGKDTLFQTDIKSLFP